MKNVSILSLVMLFFYSCEKEEKIPINIHADFQIYFDSFQIEASKRGMDNLFESSGIVIQYGDPNALTFGNPDFLIGYCDIVSNPPIININQAVWELLNERNREFTIFHELGHCVFSRQHKNELLANKEVNSMMVGGSFENVEGNKVLNYSGFRKAYYLDELFDESTPEPTWATQNYDYETLTNADKELIEDLDLENTNSKWIPQTGNCLVASHTNSSLIITNECSNSAQLINTIASYNSNDFEIEIEFKFQGEGKINVIWGGMSQSEYIQIKQNHSGTFKFEHKDPEKGLFALMEPPIWNETEFNKLNIVKAENRYYIFINDQFIYVNDYYEFAGSSLGFELFAETTVELSKLQIFRDL